MKKETLTTLKADLLTAERKRNSIRGKIESLELKELFPKWVDKFKGKYFKYINAVSRDQKWPVYIYVSDVIFRSSYRGYDIKGFAFEKDYKGDITFKTSDLYYMLDDNTDEISKVQFNQALKRINSQVESLITPS